MTFKAIIFVYLALFTANILGRDLKQSSWIWTNDQANSSTARAFQRVYTPEDGKIPVSAQIVVASGQKHDLYVNDHHIGDESHLGDDDVDESVARIRTAFLNSGPNIFTIRTHGRHGPAVFPQTGVLSSIVIKFNDGSKRELPSDSEWVATTLPYDEGRHHWGRVKVLGAYGDEPWGEIIVLPEPHLGHYGGDHRHHHHHHHHHPHGHPPVPAACLEKENHPLPSRHPDATFLKSYCAHQANHLPALTTPPLTYSNAQWIWTPETDANLLDPVGARAFRKIVCLDKGTTINALNISIDVDDTYSLFVQGNFVANSSAASWATTSHYLVNFCKPVSGPDAVVIAVEGFNGGGLANFITAIDFLGSGTNGTGVQGVVISDHTWKFDLTVPAGFEQKDYNDSTWSNAREYGTYSHGPYGAKGIPLFNNATLNTVYI